MFPSPHQLFCSQLAATLLAVKEQSSRTSDLFSQGSSGRTRGNGSKLRWRRFRRDIGKHFFTERVAKPWNRLPGDVVNAPTLSVFKTQLNNALKSML